ncbi:glycerophosphoryl diester phosphodiesterase [Nonlabens sp. Hel1_33_55]|uniref:glycerophosphodiester phosphodiesterase family protein n=1 Tax=Nonlabens sp. Hel1_33_55 TaxID=1336802 RepID=UPI000875EA0C|nr:glycerophosphodiester phosphodiesterase family protein [Nonlabens sp. Hel1_33_55]SCY39191.1 glycerophosphoryl diester phosphodiesterase [Nonlabens sp. Hel1_33_55]
MAYPFPDFLLEGHRGARGTMPENTIEGMIKAIHGGANTLEMDLQFTKDGTVVVAHDPYINEVYSLDRNGNEIPKLQARKYVIYKMTCDQIQLYDVGSKPHPNFPLQQNLKLHIPRLKDLIHAVEKHIHDNKLPPIIYNFEIKAGSQGDHLWHPAPKELTEILLNEIDAASIENRFHISSFDMRQLIELKNKRPEIPLSFLTADKGTSIQEHMDHLGFHTKIFSPYYKTVTKSMVMDCKKLGLKIIPWTVNQPAEMKRLLKMQVDGIITDYPGLLHKIRSELKV